MIMKRIMTFFRLLVTFTFIFNGQMAIVAQTTVTGPAYVCQGETAIYTASNPSGTGNFSFTLSPAMGTITVSGPQNSIATITWTLGALTASSVNVSASLNVVGTPQVGGMLVYIKKRSQITSFVLSVLSPQCAGVCRQLEVNFNGNGYTGIRDIIISQTGGPDITFLSISGNPALLTVCPNVTTTYSIKSVTAPQDTGVSFINCPADVVGQSVTVNVIPNTAITSLTASPNSSVCIGTDITLTAVASGTNLTYTWRKGPGTPILQGPLATNTFVVPGADANNSGTYEVEVNGTTCGVNPVFAQIAVNIINNPTPPTGGTLTSSQTLGCGPINVNLSVSGNTANITGWESQSNCTGVWTPISSSSSTTLNVTTPNEPTCYRVAVSDGTCSAYSTTATITIDQPPVGGIVTRNSNQTINSLRLCTSSLYIPTPTATLIPLNYVGNIVRWEKSFNLSVWNPIPPASSLTVVGSSTPNTYYRVVVASVLGICTTTAPSAYFTIIRPVGGPAAPCSLSPDGIFLDNDVVDTDKGLKIEKVYPNPTNGFISLNIENYTEGATQIDILDLMGRNVQRTQQYLDKSYNILSLDISNLSNGLYLVRIKDSDDHKAVVKVNKL